MITDGTAIAMTDETTEGETEMIEGKLLGMKIN